MSSIWWASVEKPQANPPLRGQRKVDVLIIGGGIAGILCGYVLKERGVPVILVEAREICGGMTGNTTAKLTAQHSLIYDQLLRKKGIEEASLYLKANLEAIAAYRQLAEQFDCDFEEKTAYVYSRERKDVLEREAYAYQRLGLTPLWQSEPPLPFSTVGALGMAQQAQFNPLKLLLPLASELEIYEQTTVREIEGLHARTDEGMIEADHIILATHFPSINVPGLYFLKLIQERSYVLALENAPQLDGMYIDEQPCGYSFRNYQRSLLLGGGDHKTGKNGSKWDALRHLQRQAYPQALEQYTWAAQDCMSLDQMPYIGRHRHATSNLYVATGFNKWGMTSAMVAALLLADLIVSGKSDYETLFSPSRSMLQPKLLMNGFSAIGEMIRPGKRCTHLGCSLHWNETEKTWDCGCHGSRFDRWGHIINNPAKRRKHLE